MSLWDWLNRRKKPDFYVAKSDHMMYYLQQCLASNQFGDASNFMGELILTSANRHKEEYLNESHLKQIPCERLQIIDKLWKYYSDGRFGLSVQSKIWLECGGSFVFGQCPNGFYGHTENWKAQKKFRLRVGWEDKNEQSIFCDWHNASKFNQPICEDFPLGNLPYIPQIGASQHYSYGIEGRLVKKVRHNELWFLILKRLSKCDLQ